VGQGYGGPEEGGWWFPTYEPVHRIRIGGDSWSTIIPDTVKALELYREYWLKQESGQYGSFGGWERYQVELEIAPQEWDNMTGPGKLGRQCRPHYC
jgi:hypothetical protein